MHRPMKRKIVSTLIALVFAFVCTTSVKAAAPLCVQGTVNIAAVDTAIVFGGLFSHIIIKTSTNAAIAYIDLNNNTATTADFQIDPGGSYQYGFDGDGTAAPGFHYIGATATGTLSYTAYQ